MTAATQEAIRPAAASEAEVDFDVIIIGAGLSGIGAAWYLQARMPGAQLCHPGKPCR